MVVMKIIMIVTDYMLTTWRENWFCHFTCPNNEGKKRRKEGKGLGVGRPKIISNPLPNKDMDSTLPFKDGLSTEECETDIGQFSFNFNFKCSKQNMNMAGTVGSSPSSSPSSSTPSSSSPSPSLSTSSDQLSSWSSESYSDGDDIKNGPYVRHSDAEIRKQHLVRNLVEILYVAACLQDFMLLVTQLTSGKLSPLNIAFLICLKHAKWQSLKSTMQMKFQDVTRNSG